MARVPKSDWFSSLNSLGLGSYPIFYLALNGRISIIHPRRFDYGLFLRLELHNPAIFYLKLEVRGIKMPGS